MPCFRLTVLALLAGCLLGSPAAAWTRPGHMVTAAIAYDDLAAHDPKVLDRVLELLAAHPDKGPFEVAIGRATGEAKARRLFLEMARWPDDIRGGAYDHPTWHYAMKPVVDPAAPPPRPPGQGLQGDAYEAFALNVRLAADPRAAPSERAVALCWVFHLMGDIHQPLHNAQLFSAAFPEGDHGGSQTVIDPQTGLDITLHWFWDDSVNRLGEPDPAVARGHALEAALPRAGFPELAAPATPDRFPAWGAESYDLARTLAYRPDRLDGKRLNPAYVAQATAVAERRVALAGYRLADVLRWIFAQG